MRGEGGMACFGTAMPLSVSIACTGRDRTRARGRPTDGMGGSRRLGVDDGGWGLLVAQWQGLACPLHPGWHEWAWGDLELRGRGREAGVKQALAGGVLGFTWVVVRC
jgi:hypothetical protein